MQPSSLAPAFRDFYQKYSWPSCITWKHLIQAKVKGYVYVRIYNGEENLLSEKKNTPKLRKGYTTLPRHKKFIVEAFWSV